MNIKHDHLRKILCPPGMGVHTVHTAKDLKDKYFDKVYQNHDPKYVEKKWLESLVQIIISFINYRTILVR